MTRRQSQRHSRRFSARTRRQSAGRHVGGATFGLGGTLRAAVAEVTSDPELKGRITAIVRDAAMSVAHDPAVQRALGTMLSAALRHAAVDTAQHVIAGPKPV